MWRSLVGLFLIVVSASVPRAAAQTGPEASREWINVKDLRATDPAQNTSARGDGTTDDTAALQAAADLARKLSYIVKPEGGSYLGSSPALYFPAGRYVISDEIRLGPYTNIVSDSKAIIEQKSPDKRSFVFNDVYTISIRGLRFLGGKHQVWMDNRNVDSTILDLSECEFQLSTDTAIVTHGTASPTDQHMSASLTINRCKFIRPRKVLRNVCDYAVVRDSWVTIHKNNFERDSAAFANLSGVLMFDNLIGVPVFGAIDAQGRQNLDNRGIDRVRWVDNHGSLLVQKSRFGGEFGGIPIVHHFGRPDTAYPRMGQTISIENSWICAGPSSRQDSAVVTLRDGIPQLLRIIGNSQLVDGTYLRNEGFDVAAFLQASPDARDRIRFDIHSNMTWPATPPTVPRELGIFLTREAPR
jgi:hypothetical protein